MLRRATRCPQLGQPQVSPGAVRVRVASGRPFRGTERGSWASCHYRGAHRGRTLRTSSSCSGTLGCTGASVGTAQNTLGSKTNSQASHKLNKIQHYSWIEPDGYNFLMVTPPTVVRHRQDFVAAPCEQQNTTLQTQPHSAELLQTTHPQWCVRLSALHKHINYEY